MTLGVLVLIFLLFMAVPSPRAQTKEEKEFMKQHEQEMTAFMEKCTGCHSAQRILGKRLSKEEWERVLKVMADKPHSNISAEELQRIQRWNDFMQSTISPRP
ncbi:MAG: hypothetical protein IH628_04450 [Proteobacteria bacterium]|nr:hypothetical protein [Pseudomonadota bacterium]